MEATNEYRVDISPRAAQMLVSHAAFLARVSPDAAERLTAAFEEAANSLRFMPQRCPYVSDESIVPNTYRSLLFCKRYAILFQVAGNTVYANYVVDCRQGYPWLSRP